MQSTTYGQRNPGPATYGQPYARNSIQSSGYEQANYAPATYGQGGTTDAFSHGRGRVDPNTYRPGVSKLVLS